MSEPVQLALIGAGRMGRMHLQALAQSQQLRIAAIVDPSPESLHAAHAVDPSPSGYPSLDAALEHTTVEGVLIAAPTPLHASLVTACAERALPMLCEKPCGFSTAEIDAAAAAADAAGVLLQIGYWRRFVPELIELRGQLRDGRFGELLQLSCWQWDGEPPAMSFRATSGGIMTDMGVHEIDQIRWLTGRDILRAGEPAASKPVGDDVDCAVVDFELDGGGVGTVSLGRHFPHGDCVWVEVMGTGGHARVDVLWEARGKTWHPALKAQAEDFARCVRSGEPSSGASARDARRTLELAAQTQARIRPPAPVTA